MNHIDDVIISGGGLVGGSLALALQHSGLAVSLVEQQSTEQKKHSPAGDRVLAIAHGSKTILQQSGLWQTVSDTAEPIQSIQVSDRGFLGKARLNAIDEGVDALGYVVEARQLDLKTAELLQDSTVNVIAPAKIIEHQSQSPEAVTVKIEHADGSHEPRQTRLLIAADGGNSLIRQQLGIHSHQIDYDQTAVITRVHSEIPVDGIAYERFTENGPLAFLPMGRRNYSVVWTLAPATAHAMMQASEQVFTQQLQHAFGFRLGRLTLIDKRYAFPLQLQLSESMIANRIALIGNAAHQIHPVAGQGFNLGLRDAACLARLLGELDSSNSDPGNTELLTTYSEHRKSDHQRVVDITNSLIWLFSSDWQLLGHTRSLGLMALDRIPWLKHRLAKSAMGL